MEVIPAGAEHAQWLETLICRLRTHSAIKQVHICTGSLASLLLSGLPPSHHFPFSNLWRELVFTTASTRNIIEKSIFRNRCLPGNDGDPGKTSFRAGDPRKAARAPRTAGDPGRTPMWTGIQRRPQKNGDPGKDSGGSRADLPPRGKPRFNDVATGCYRVAGFTKNSSAAGPRPTSSPAL